MQNMPERAYKPAAEKARSPSSHPLNIVRWITWTVLLIGPFCMLLQTGNALQPQKAQDLPGALSLVTLQLLLAGAASVVLCLPPLLSHVAAWAAEHHRTRLALALLGLLLLSLFVFGCGSVTLGIWATLSGYLGDLALPGGEWLEDYAFAILILSICGSMWIMPNVPTLVQLGRRVKQAREAAR
jgi:hypothetical protein